jgi:hypothetical protein
MDASSNCSYFFKKKATMSLVAATDPFIFSIIFLNYLKLFCVTYSLN